MVDYKDDPIAYRPVAGDTEELELPVVDMNAPEEEIVAALMASLKQLGFLVLKNAPGYSEKELHAIVEKFFADLTPEKRKEITKKQWVPENKTYYRGLAPFMENNRSYKEMMEIGLKNDNVPEHRKDCPLYEATPWPAEGYDDVKEYMDKYTAAMQENGIKIMQYLAIGLGIDRHFFDSWFNKDSVSSCKFLHYEPRTEQKEEWKLDDHTKLFTTPPHTDSGFLTLLSTFHYPGLEVETTDPTTGVREYKKVKVEPETLVVNIGEMFSRILGYKLKATMHRVSDIGRRRYAVPYFFEPAFDTEIPMGLDQVVPQGEEESKKEESKEEVKNDAQWVNADASVAAAHKEKYMSYGKFYTDRLVDRLSEYYNVKFY